MNIQILAPYPLGHAPSQRFRFEQYLNLLKERQISYKFQSFFDPKGWEILYRDKHMWARAMAVLRGYWRSFTILFKLSNCSVVFIHREVTPLGPPFIEWVIAKVLKKKIIYDFDDAIWLTDLDKKHWFKIMLKNPSKVNSIIKWSWRVSCGNRYLADHAAAFNKNVFINPTTVDTINYHNVVKNQHSSKPVVGWTGSHSTLTYLESFFPILSKVHEALPFEFILICNKKPAQTLPFMTYIHWREQSEIEDLLKINIGIMPLPDDQWAKGKCGFKAIQYMALGIPALVSPVGVNSEVVNHGENGYVCSFLEDWKTYLITLLNNENLRIEMGKKARLQIEQRYSLSSNSALFLSMILDKNSPYIYTR